MDSSVRFEGKRRTDVLTEVRNNLSYVKGGVERSSKDAFNSVECCLMA